jgi:hypothetical protein
LGEEAGGKRRAVEEEETSGERAGTDEKKGSLETSR